jgi:hypothetical protein
MESFIVEVQISEVRAHKVLDLSSFKIEIPFVHLLDIIVAEATEG